METISWIDSVEGETIARAHVAYGWTSLESIIMSNSGVAVFVAELLMTLDQLISSDYRR